MLLKSHTCLSIPFEFPRPKTHALHLQQILKELASKKDQHLQSPFLATETVARFARDSLRALCCCSTVVCSCRCFRNNWRLSRTFAPTKVAQQTGDFTGPFSQGQLLHSPPLVEATEPLLATGYCGHWLLLHTRQPYPSWVSHHQAHHGEYLKLDSRNLTGRMLKPQPSLQLFAHAHEINNSACDSFSVIIQGFGCKELLRKVPTANANLRQTCNQH